MSAMSSRPRSSSRRQARRPRSRRSKTNISRLALIVVAIIIGVVIVNGAQKCSRDKNTAIPNAATADAASADIGSGDLCRVILPEGTPDVTLDYEGFRVGFNPDRHVANYVAWELTADEVRASESSRSEARFAADPRVPSSATPDDYRKSGFDRGHMAPAADFKWSKLSMDHCHLMTNIVPQTHTLNAGPWKTVEENSRNWALRDSAIIIICGPVLTDRLTRTIGTTGVVVPERFYKVILAPYANPPRGIGFVMSNYDQTGGAQATATTIDEVESITGIDFFSELPDEVEDAVEAQNEYNRWQRRR